jgi:hypothetical protein
MYGTGCNVSDSIICISHDDDRIKKRGEFEGSGLNERRDWWARPDSQQIYGGTG